MCNIIEDNNHMFIKCRNVENILDYFKVVLKDVCNITHLNMEKIVFFEIKTVTKKELNTATILTANYISTIWYNRCRYEPLDPRLLKTNIIKHQRILSQILKNQMQNIFTEKYCKHDNFT